jgi:hypothetical protein
MHLELNHEISINIRQRYLNIKARRLGWASNLYTAPLIASLPYIPILSLSTAGDQEI